MRHLVAELLAAETTVIDLEQKQQQQKNKPDLLHQKQKQEDLFQQEENQEDLLNHNKNPPGNDTPSADDGCHGDVEAVKNKEVSLGTFLLSQFGTRRSFLNKQNSTAKEESFTDPEFSSVTDLGNVTGLDTEEAASFAQHSPAAEGAVTDRASVFDALRGLREQGAPTASQRDQEDKELLQY